ncbi:MAG: hypothetical protein AAB425_09990 [Bdellovibrionota bacterium]
MRTLLLIPLAFCWNQITFAGVPLIEIAADQTAEAVRMDALFTGDFYQENVQEIQDRAKARIDESPELDETLKTALKAEVDSLPFHRILDIEIVPVTGFPDTLAVCLEGHPVLGIRVEGCAGITIFVALLSANIKYRFDYTWKTKRGKFRQLGAGPGVGLRQMEACLFGLCESLWFVDFLGSIEYVGWINRHLGITVQLDAGAISMIHAPEGGESDNPAIPMGRLSIGVAF